MHFDSSKSDIEPLARWQMMAFRQASDPVRAMEAYNMCVGSRGRRLSLQGGRPLPFPLLPALNTRKPGSEKALLHL